MTAGSFWFRLSLGGCRFGGRQQQRRQQQRRGVRSSADATVSGGSPQQQVGVKGVPAGALGPCAPCPDAHQTVDFECGPPTCAAGPAEPGAQERPDFGRAVARRRRVGPAAHQQAGKRGDLANCELHAAILLSASARSRQQPMISSQHRTARPQPPPAPPTTPLPCPPHTTSSAERHQRV